jgi:hypothetical protein
VPAVDAASRAYIVKIDLPALRQPAVRHVRPRDVPSERRKVLALPAAPWWSADNCNRSSVADEDGVARTRLITTGKQSANWSKCFPA